MLAVWAIAWKLCTGNGVPKGTIERILFSEFITSIEVFVGNVDSL
jgi:hypothetical protein